MLQPDPASRITLTGIMNHAVMQAATNSDVVEADGDGPFGEVLVGP
jgi:hypothetical protein